MSELAIPPAHLMKLSVNSADEAKFLQRGKQSYDKVVGSLQSLGLGRGPGTRILEWGCGCGRIARHFNGYGGEFHGIDINGEAVEWCRQNLPFGQFQNCDLRPPLSFPSEYFDAIYAGSVLTHLSISSQLAWMQELFRVLKRDGLLLLTFHGGYHIVRAHRRDGFLFSHVNAGLFAEHGHGEGSNDYGSYQTREATREIFFPFIERAHIEFHDILGGQDTIIFSKGVQRLSGHSGGMDQVSVVLSSESLNAKPIEVEIRDLVSGKVDVQVVKVILERQTKIIHVPMSGFVEPSVVVRGDEWNADAIIYSRRA